MSVRNTAPHTGFDLDGRRSTRSRRTRPTTRHRRPDIWVNPTVPNAQRVLAALAAFDAPLTDLTIQDLTSSDAVFQIGVVPCRIDILSGISGVAFGDAWTRRVVVQIEGIDMPVIGRGDFVSNKRTSGRPKDRLDLELLGE